MIRATIESTLTAGREVQKRILDEVARHGYDENSAFAIKLALEEGVINAVKHGNKFDPAKQVHIEASVTDKQIDIAIEDQGPGFDRSSVPDPTLDENLEKCSGRGILLIEAYMTKVTWSNRGRKVHMTKVNESA